MLKVNVMLKILSIVLGSAPMSMHRKLIMHKHVNPTKIINS